MTLIEPGPPRPYTNCYGPRSVLSLVIQKLLELEPLEKMRWWERFTQPRTWRRMHL